MPTWRGLSVCTPPRYSIWRAQRRDGLLHSTREIRRAIPMDVPRPFASREDAVAATAARRHWLSLLRLARMLSASISPRRRLWAALLAVAASLSEGIGFALLAALIAIRGAPTSPPGSTSRMLVNILAAMGLAPTLPTLVVLFVGLVASRALIAFARDVNLAALSLDFV